MQDNYILEALQSASRIIIPQVGAFMKKQSDDGKTIIAFNSILKFDDGKLTEFLAAKESIQKDEAKAKIKAYGDALLKEINGGKQYKISGLGNIYKDANGKIQFIADNNAAPTEQEKNQPEPKKPAPEVKKPEITPDGSKMATATPVKPKADTETKTTPASKPVAKPGTKKTPEKYSPHAAKSGSNQGFIITIAVVLALSIGVAAYLLFFTKPTTDNSLTPAPELHDLEQIEQEIVQELNDSAVMDTVDAIAEELKEEAEAEIQATENTANIGMQYYIVAGCFKVEENANKYVNRLKDQGYDAKKFAVIRNGLHAVSYSNHTNRNEAIQNMYKLRNEGKQCWMLKY